MAKAGPGNDRTSGLTSAQLQWRRWLRGSREAIDGADEFCNAVAIREGNVRDWLRVDWARASWLFPADRYSAQSPATPTLTEADAPALLEGLDDELRCHYVGFLSLLGATVDWHGWVQDWRIEEPGVRKLPELGQAGVLAVARVLRFLHVAGWRGYSDDGYRDPQDFWYDKALYSWLQSTWRWQAQPGQPLPEVWRDAMRDDFTPRQASEPRSLAFDVALLLQRCHRRVCQFGPEAWVGQDSQGQGTGARKGPPPVSRLL